MAVDDPNDIVIQLGIRALQMPDMTDDETLYQMERFLAAWPIPLITRTMPFEAAQHCVHVADRHYARLGVPGARMVRVLLSIVGNVVSTIFLSKHVDTIACVRRVMVRSYADKRLDGWYEWLVALQHYAQLQVGWKPDDGPKPFFDARLNDSRICTLPDALRGLLRSATEFCLSADETTHFDTMLASNFGDPMFSLVQLHVHCDLFFPYAMLVQHDSVTTHLSFVHILDTWHRTLSSTCPCWGGMWTRAASGLLHAMTREPHEARDTATSVVVAAVRMINLAFSYEANGWQSEKSEAAWELIFAWLSSAVPHGNAFLAYTRRIRQPAYRTTFAIRLARIVRLSIAKIGCRVQLGKCVQRWTQLLLAHCAAGFKDVGDDFANAAALVADDLEMAPRLRDASTHDRYALLSQRVSASRGARLRDGRAVRATRPGVAACGGGRGGRVRRRAPSAHASRRARERERRRARKDEQAERARRQAQAADEVRHASEVRTATDAVRRACDVARTKRDAGDAKGAYDHVTAAIRRHHARCDERTRRCAKELKEALRHPERPDALDDGHDSEGSVAQDAPAGHDACCEPAPAGDDDDALVCPITLERLRHPVILSDGHTYEESAAREWLRGHTTSPMTGEELQDPTMVVVNHMLKTMLHM